MTDIKHRKKSSASFKDRLKNIAKRQKKVPHLIYLTYVFERFLYRLSISEYIDNLILKGGLLLYCEGKTYRQTRDIDLLCQNIPNEEATIRKMIEEICTISISDHIQFKTKQIEIAEQMILTQNPGFKIMIPFEFNTIQDQMQIDLSFGEIIIPNARKIIFPLLLKDHVPFSIFGYSIESLVAEKLNAIYVIGDRNTRMKDYYDLFILLEIDNFKQKVLLDAIKSTFANRNTNIESLSLLNILRNKSFSNEFEKYCKKIKISIIPFAKISQRLIKGFLPIFILIEENIIPEDRIKWDPTNFQWD